MNSLYFNPSMTIKSANFSLFFTSLDLFLILLSNPLTLSPVMLPCGDDVLQFLSFYICTNYCAPTLSHRLRNTIGGCTSLDIEAFYISKLLKLWLLATWGKLLTLSIFLIPDEENCWLASTLRFEVS